MIHQGVTFLSLGPPPEHLELAVRMTDVEHLRLRCLAQGESPAARALASLNCLAQVFFENCTSISQFLSVADLTCQPGVHVQAKYGSPHSLFEKACPVSTSHSSSQSLLMSNACGFSACPTETHRNPYKSTESMEILQKPIEIHKSIASHQKPIEINRIHSKSPETHRNR